MACLLIAPVTTFVRKEAPANRGRPHRCSPHTHMHLLPERVQEHTTYIMCPRYSHLHTMPLTIINLQRSPASAASEDSPSFSITCRDYRERLASPVCISSG